jgi:hypothetical protein
MAKYIPDQILKPFMKSYERGNVWQIHVGDRWITFFLYFDSQIEENKNLPIYQQIREEYFKLVDKYLDIRLSGLSDISLTFDSKENFERKYHGDWYGYYH